MRYLSVKSVTVFAVVSVIGTLLHFLYELIPAPLTAIFSPVNESIWEHLKMLFWPGLTGSIILAKGKENGTFASYGICILLSSFLMQTVGYFSHVVIECDALWFDIALYYILMALTLLVPSALEPKRFAVIASTVAVLVAGLGVMIVLFTFLPPRSILFRELP